MQEKRKKADSFWITIIFFSIILFSFAFFDRYDFAAAQSSGKDAIAIRIIPNIEHYSALRWYKNQKFTGSPQSLLVDGYNAIRDGRTVYVNVANVSADVLYTNIYLITYNQESEKATQDIFSNIIKNWKFNTNISGFGHCRQHNSLVCDLDSECPLGDFCDGPKALLARDTKRLEDLSAIKISLNNYYLNNGYYPRLQAGTYLPGKSLTVWPSWQEQFKTEIGISLPRDPINRLGPCCPAEAGFVCANGTYNPTTCWDENKKIFATNLPSVLPHNSLAYLYNASTDGKAFDLCAVLESGFKIGGNQVISDFCASPCIDMDNDGYGLFANSKCKFNIKDCDDTNPEKFGGVSEICNNNIDDDCDGFRDCNDPDCFSSFDCVLVSNCNNNGTCDTGETIFTCPYDCTCIDDGECTKPECPGPNNPATCADCECGNGIVNSICGEQCDGGDDCNINCTSIAPTCTDSDHDRYIKSNTAVINCGNVCGSFGDESCLGNNDCDDTRADVYPTKSEICDGIDNDCDGSIDGGLNIEACAYVCEAAGHDYNANRGGNLSCCGNDPLEGPYVKNESDYCTDGRDNDCDGYIDETDTDCMECNANNNLNESFWYVFGQLDCNQCDHEGDDNGNQSINNSNFWNAYPGMADKCDAVCGTVAATVTWDQYEHGVETKCDSLDNDCDGQIDEDLPTTPTTCGVGACASQGTLACVNGQMVNSCTPGQPSPEICDGIDNNCDGFTDEGCTMNTYCIDADGDGYGKIGSETSAFTQPDGYVTDCTDCNDNSKYAYPGHTETCDNIDNDCDGSIDEGCDDDGDDYCDNSMLWFNTTLSCQFTLSGTSGNDCNDANSNVNPGKTEIKCNGIDDDCNPLTLDSDLEEEAAGNCDDGIDNDCDGKTDSADPDCTNYCDFTFTFPCVLR